MKTKIALIIGLFALVALGTVLVASEKVTAAPVSFESAAQGFVTPMAGSCNWFCSACLPVGHNGACTAGRSCC